MSEREQQRETSQFRRVWRTLYILTPAVLGVPFGVFAQHHNVALPVYCVLPAWLLFAALWLLFTWRDFLFLVWGAPLAFALLALTLCLGSNCGGVAGGMCNGVVMLWAVGPAFVVLALGFLVGLLGFAAGGSQSAV